MACAVIGTLKEALVVCFHIFMSIGIYFFPSISVLFMGSIQDIHCPPFQIPNSNRDAKQQYGMQKHSNKFHMNAVNLSIFPFPVF